MPIGLLPTDLLWPRSAVLACAAASLAAMALSTRRRARGAPASMLLGGLLAANVPFALAHVWMLGGAIVMALLVLWMLIPLAVAPPAAATLYALCAFDEVRRAARTSASAWAAFAAGFALPCMLAVTSVHAVRGAEAVLTARLVDPDLVLDEREFAPLRAIGWIDRWDALQDVRRTWLDEDPPAYRGRALRARQVLHALTGKFGDPAPGATTVSTRRED